VRKKLLEEDRGDLPGGWMRTTLGTLCRFEYGKGLPRKDRRDGKYPVYGSNGIVGYHNKCLIKGRSIIIGRKGSSGKINISEEDCWPIDTTYYITENSVDINFDFLTLLLKSLRLDELDRSTAIPGLNREEAYKIQVPLAPLQEQTRIVRKVSNLYERLNKTKQELAKIPPLLKKFRQSVLAKAFSGELTKEWRKHQKDLEPASKLLERIREERKKKLGKKYKESTPIDTSDLPGLPEGWEWVRLDQIVNILDSMRVPINSKEREKRKGNIPYYGANGQVGWIDDFIFDEPLVLLAEDGGFFNTWDKPNAYMITGKSWVNNHAHVLRPCKGIDIEIILHALNNTWLMPYVQGTTRYKLNQSAMRKVPIPLPPKDEQRQIIRKINDFYTQADTIEKSVKIAQAHCEKLSQSILAKAFRGELVEQDPNDEPADKLLAKIAKKK